MKTHHIQQFAFDHEKLTIEWADQHRSHYHYIWLRDNAPNNRHANGQKLIDSALIPLDSTARSINEHGYLEYGERVNMREHMLQAAVFAERDGADDLMIAAALLHDYGHFTHGLGEDIADHGVDGKHEEVGAVYLQAYFCPEVIEPMRLHVAAKRYLCAVDAEYFATLSPASIQSLALQGGPFSPKEVQEFEQNPYFKEAVQVRLYDEAGKVPGMETPPIEYYRPYMEKALL